MFVLFRQFQGIPPLDVRIKWPNDLYLDGLKVGGILCTSTYRSKKFNVCAGKLLTPTDIVCFRFAVSTCTATISILILVHLSIVLFFLKACEKLL